MLDRICISRHRRLSPHDPLDMGALGEAMLFYGEVRLVADQAVLAQLIRELDPGAIVAMLSEGLLHITYVDGGYGIRTDNTGSPFERHSPISYRLPDWAFDKVTDQAFEKKIGNGSKSRRLRRRISPFVNLETWDDRVIGAVLEDLRSGAYVTEAVRTIVSSVAPNLQDVDQLQFGVHEEDGSFVVSTNIDFVAVNQEFHRRVPPDIATVTPAFILTEIVESQLQLQRSSYYDAEIVASGTTSQLLQLKCEDLLGGARHLEAIDLFQDRLLEGRAVRDAINSGARSFSDLIEVIVAARDFRSWLDGKPDDYNLLNAYYEEITRRTWLSSLQGRTLRWAVFGGAGFALAHLGLPTDAATAAPLGLGAIDTILLDRILRGWRPDQFVEGKLLPFVRDDG
jgi:hypothetical protein